MSIRPIDMQAMVQKSVEIGKMNNNESGRSELSQQQFAQTLQKRVSDQSQTVAQTDKTEEQMIDKDGKGPGSERERKRRNKNNAEQDSNEQKPKSSSMFDISI